MFLTDTLACVSLRSPFGLGLLLGLVILALLAIWELFTLLLGR